MNIEKLILTAKERRASDIHIVCGLPIRIRVDGELVDFEEPAGEFSQSGSSAAGNFNSAAGAASAGQSGSSAAGESQIMTRETCEAYARELLGDRFAELESAGEVDFAGTYAGLRCRLNVFRQQGSLSSAIRILNDKIPEISTLGLPNVVPTFADFKRGIVIVTGETGSGKSTTLASLIDKVNHTRRHHIITLEDPIEYVYVPDKCTINQREIGIDTNSYESGLKAILREDPDIILIGEMRSLDTIETALTAAETGHLVFATLHTNSAANTIDRIVNVFPGEKQQQIRLQLSMTLQAVIAQQLLPRASGKGRVLACEIMKTNSAIKNLIREAKTPQIINAITTSANEGNITMDNTLTRLARNGDITADTAVSAAHDVDYVKSALGMRTSAPKDRMMIR